LGNVDQWQSDPAGGLVQCEWSFAKVSSLFGHTDINTRPPEGYDEVDDRDLSCIPHIRFPVLEGGGGLRRPSKAGAREERDQVLCQGC